MSQSRSQGKRAPTSSGSLRPLARAGGLGSTSSSQHVQSIKDIKDDIGALEQEFSRLEKEINDSNNEYNSSVANARHLYRNTISRIYSEHLEKLFDMYKKSMAEDTKKQENQELVSALQKQIDEIEKLIADQAEKIKATRSKNPASRVIEATRRIKANAIREKPEEIKKLNGTTEGMQVVEDSNAKLTRAFEQFQRNLLDIDKQYPEKTGKVFERHKEIEKILDEKNIPKVPGNRAEAFARTGSRDLRELLEKTKEKNKNDERRELLKK